jgi:hypothetical protein
MPIYTYKCPSCGLVEEHLSRQKITDNPLLDIEWFHYLCPNGKTEDNGWTVTMQRVLSVPSPAQWGCRRP